MLGHARLLAAPALLGLLVTLAACGGKKPNGPPAKGDKTSQSGPAIKPEETWVQVKEAEDAEKVSPNFKKVTGEFGDEVGGKGWLEIPENANGKQGDPDAPTGDQGPKVYPGNAEFTFQVPQDGSYALWLRAWSPDACGDSCYYKVRGTEKWNLYHADTTRQVWRWKEALQPPFNQPAELELKKGLVTIVLGNREDGLRLDQIALATPDWEPMNRTEPLPTAKEGAVAKP